MYYIGGVLILLNLKLHRMVLYCQFTPKIRPVLVIFHPYFTVREGMYTIFKSILKSTHIVHKYNKCIIGN